MKYVVLYVPGLGDKKRWLLWLQKQALKTWRVYGVRVEMLTMRWADDAPLEPRFKKLISRIDELHKAGNKVSLVGTSAGASAVISAFSLKTDKIDGVVTICGKLKGDMPDAIKELNPCFAESFEMLKKSLKKLNNNHRKRIMALTATRDSVVPPEEATIDDAVNKQLRTAGHNITCSYALLFKPRLITRFLKSLA